MNRCNLYGFNTILNPGELAKYELQELYPNPSDPIKKTEWTLGSNLKKQSGGGLNDFSVTVSASSSIQTTTSTNIKVRVWYISNTFEDISLNIIIKGGARSILQDNNPSVDGTTTFKADNCTGFKLIWNYNGLYFANTDATGNLSKESVSLKAIKSGLTNVTLIIYNPNNGQLVETIVKSVEIKEKGTSTQLQAKLAFQEVLYTIRKKRLTVFYNYTINEAFLKSLSWGYSTQVLKLKSDWHQNGIGFAEFEILQANPTKVERISLKGESHEKIKTGSITRYYYAMIDLPFGMTISSSQSITPEGSRVDYKLLNLPPYGKVQWNGIYGLELVSENNSTAQFKFIKGSSANKGVKATYTWGSNSNPADTFNYLKTLVIDDFAVFTEQVI